MTLDSREDVSYPELFEDRNGNIYIIYDRERNNCYKLNRETWVSAAAKEILISRLRVDDIINNKLSNGSYLGRVLSKAKIDLVEF